ncbi:DUF1684 domain-containing protein [Kaistella antarctica]|uniref:Protein of uncharacterized function (DUF1684) n=1 Tax=Kaistella antarctica TaxID=266748 RepID=A0A448NPY1_9FLAO|nr:DUF1684 domain-containing protein [Kaistella antarctica]KEY19261.1 hypothetical protein HY04_12655 [Kaistella antarctica]SEW04755.1 hypothetical protein SAMN05421765_1971 [Kaistella antarctica]VEH98592.1 Protein of uncharacterised function (DUF1684) [Kaistella antarctica]
MKKFFILMVGLLLTSCASQSKTALISEIQKFQKDLNAEFTNPKKTPLRGDNFTKFTEHPFFPANLKYRVSAKLTKTENAVPFEIETSSGRTKPYQEYGKARFILDGQELTLTIYQSLGLMKQAGYEDYLFLLFRDATNEIETYGGGKYMDLKIPKGDTIILDFNKSYHPLCAYNAYDYSCPIVPAENFLPVRIEAGVMYEDVYHD